MYAWGIQHGYSADTAGVDWDGYTLHTEWIISYPIILDQSIKSDRHLSGVDRLSGVKVALE